MRPTETKSKVLHKCQLLLLSFLYWGFRYPGMILPLILNYFISLLPFQWHSYTVCHMCCRDFILSFILCFFLFLFLIKGECLEFLYSIPACSPKLKVDLMPTQPFLSPRVTGEMWSWLLALLLSMTYFIFLRQSYSTTWLVGAEINKLSKVTEPRIELGVLSHQRQCKIFLHLL